MFRLRLKVATVVLLRFSNSRPPRKGWLFYYQLEYEAVWKDWKTKGIVVLGLLCFLDSAYSDTFVNGYMRSNGTYVAPHFQSSPNGTSLDNWSTKGNVNPYTGKAGTKNTNGGNVGFYSWPLVSQQQVLPQNTVTSQSASQEPLVPPTYNPNAMEAQQVRRINFRDGRVCEYCSIVTNQGYVAQVVHPTEGVWPIPEGEYLSISSSNYRGPTLVGPQRRVLNSGDLVLEELEQKIFGTTFPKDLTLVRVNRLANAVKANQRQYTQKQNILSVDNEALDEPWRVLGSQGK